MLHALHIRIMNRCEIYSALFSGTIDSVNLPEELDLTPLYEDMERLWQQSIANIANSVVIEYAATIVLKADGALALTNEISGNSFEVTPVPCVESGEVFVGTFHTHPRIDGLMPMPFSAEDIVSAITFGENISVVRTGNSIFALVRTVETAVAADVNEAKSEFEATVILILRHRDVSILDDIWMANQILCRKYRLALYAGTIGQPLKEVYIP